MYKQRFIVIGMTDDREVWFPPEVQSRIAGGHVFSGGARHHEIVSHLLPADARWIEISVPLDAVFEQYKGLPEVVVFASGDPLFFGFANTLRRRLPEAKIVVYPAPNSLQLLSQRLLLDYHGMRCVSLTGRPWDDFDAALIRGEVLIGALTDRVKTPAAAAARMLEYGYENYRMHVGVALGNREEERLWSGSLAEATTMEFGFPNCFILERTTARQRSFGIPESEFEGLPGRPNMITKMPYRLLALSALDLQNRHSFWDVGFCTGSVSIEARLQFPHLKINAFEIREEGRALLGTNARRFGAPGIEMHIGDFLAADLQGIPAPDAVFIGGHGGRLPEMLQRINEVLLPGGVIVFNGVSEESRALFRQSAAAVGRRITSTMNVAVDAFNPIEILKAE
ncbi:MAG: precorrin-6y C5,15-methyltransferase (decarboxylating) subunit CbiE [Bacteroidales bacterium]|nr:precorrin-6y C5,15-methyltransferase (decarboxylating) subunit CbiE [Bacteroidales bacterium]